MARYTGPRVKKARRYGAHGTSTELSGGIGLDIRSTGFLTAAQSPAFANRLPRDTFTLRFYPDGSTSGAAIRLSQGRSAYRVDVDWLLGRVSVSKDPGDAY